jgi:hypothetical protein
MLERAKRASHIDPPASSYAIMRRARPYRGENPEPGKDVHGELDPWPGIREQPGSFSTDLARRSAGDAENAQQCAVSQLSGRSRQTANDVLGDLAGKSPGAQKVHDSYVAFRDKIAAWSRISTQAMLEARGG